MADGFDATTFLLQGVSAYIRSVIYNNNFFFEEGSSLLTDVENQRGTAFEFPIEYSHTSNGGTFNYDDPMPESDKTSGVLATFNKDQWQKAVRTYNTLKAYNVGEGQTIDQTALGTALGNDRELNMTLAAMRATIVSTFISDLESQIDSSGTYSDSSLTRSTYGLASYEDTTGGALTLALLDDCIEALTGTSYGGANEGDLVWLMPTNQRTNLSRLESANIGSEVSASNLSMVTNAQDPSPMDAGRIARTKTYNQIPIVVVPGMTTTNIILARKGTLRRCVWRPLEIDDKTPGVMADQKLLHVKFGANVFCDMPSWNGKISGLTA